MNSTEDSGFNGSGINEQKLLNGSFCIHPQRLSPNVRTSVSESMQTSKNGKQGRTRTRTNSGEKYSAGEEYRERLNSLRYFIDSKRGGSDQVSSVKTRRMAKSPPQRMANTPSQRNTKLTSQSTKTPRSWVRGKASRNNSQEPHQRSENSFSESELLTYKILLITFRQSSLL